MLWLDDRLVEGSVAPFDVTDRGLTLGDGVFDTALALNGRIAFEDRHRDRLVEAARTLGFAVEPERITRAMRGLAALAPRLVIRTTVTRGKGARGIRPPANPTVTVFASAVIAPMGLAFEPLRLWTTSIRRNETSPASRLKTLGYLDAVLAISEAVERGYDEALFLNTKGTVACAGTGNIFAISGTDIVTPPLDDGVLAGVIRGEVLGLSRDSGLVAHERPLTPDDLAAADAVFLTNSLRLLAPVTVIGSQSFTSDDDPRVTALQHALRKRVADACGLSADAI